MDDGGRKRSQLSNADDSDASPTFVLRGGSFNSTASDCASSAREVVASSAGWRKGQNAGFRIALAPVDEPETPESASGAE